MRVAIVDLGTNSVRFDVHQIGPGKKVAPLHREKLMIRLGQGVFLSGRLDRDTYRRTLEAFESFAHTARSLRATRIVAFGTSALREAADSQKLLKQILDKTGIDVRVISGKEEATLIARGILAHENLPKGKSALIDIGGGSTEISIVANGEIVASESFPLGTARLQQVFLKTTPPKREALEELRRHIRGSILPKIIAEDWPRASIAMGSSGTIRALAKILKAESRGSDRGFELRSLKKLVKRMSKYNTTELLAIEGMESKRVDMILAGAVLLEESLIAIKARSVRITEQSLRDGILDEEVEAYRRNTSSHVGFHLDDLLAQARNFSVSDEHVTQVRALSERLFDGLKRVHKLKPEWRNLLSAAAILHDVGEAVAPTHHERHSYYIVKNADIPSMQPWEREFVAQLCLWHRGGKPDRSLMPFGGNRKLYTAFMQLLSLLRLADAMDRSHKALAQIVRIGVSKKRVTISLKGLKRSSLNLELLRLEQKKSLFESVTGRELEFKRLA